MPSQPKTGTARLSGRFVMEALAAWFRIDLWKRVMGGLALGALIGLALRYGLGDTPAKSLAEAWIQPWGDLFLRLIRMLIIPLVFATLVSGVIAMGDPKRLGSLGGRAIGMYLVTTAFAVTLGLIAGTVLQPGKGLSAETFASASIKEVSEKKTTGDAAGGLGQRLIEIIPDNPVAALANGDILPVIFFALLLGVGIMVAGPVASGIGKWFEGAAAAMIKMTMIVMETAPLGVFALIATQMATHGLGILQNLGMLALALFLACAIHIVLVYGSIMKGLLRLPFIRFISGISDAQAVAFSTASSSATLPVTIACAEKNLGIKKSVAGSVLPLGATINMDGTAIYIGIVTLFGTQALGIEMTLASYVVVAVMACLVSIGAAGIPSAGLILSIAAMTDAGIGESQALLIVGFIYPFDRLLDMVRTLTNVTGDAAIATSIAKWENEFDEEVFRSTADMSITRKG